jgi:hypothetical protein
MDGWIRRIARTVGYLVGVPSLAPQGAASQPVPWLATRPFDADPVDTAPGRARSQPCVRR